MQQLIITSNNQEWNLLLDNTNEYWITADELGKHLGYADPDKVVNTFYSRNLGCFRENIDTKTIVIKKNKRNTKVQIL